MAPRAGQDRAISYIADFLPTFLGTAFVETRRYDHQMLVPFLDEEVGMLSGVAASEYSVLRDRFANFVHILSDLQLNAVFFPTVTLSPAEYARRCLDAADMTQSDLFKTIIQQDSSLALALASLIGAELPVHMPGLFVESCDDWYVASALIDGLRSGDSGEYETKSCALLAEASLRYPSVSFLLDTIHAPRETHYRWHLLRRHHRQTYEASGFLRSLLTVVLQRATAESSSVAIADELEGVDLHRLAAVRDAPKPNNWWLGHRSASALQALGALALPIVLFVALLLPGSNLTDDSGIKFAGWLVLGISGAVSVALISVGIMIKVRVKLFRIIHRPHIDLDYLRPFGQRSWATRWTYWVTRFRYGQLVDVIVQLDREPFTSLLRRH